MIVFGPVDPSTRAGLAQIDAMAAAIDDLEGQQTTGPQPLTVREYYRFQEMRYSGGVLMLTKHVYPVVKETPAGVWIDLLGQRRFVRRDARKRFACPTEQEALESYHARKRRQVRILRAQLAAAEAALSLTSVDQTAPFVELG